MDTVEEVLAHYGVKGMRWGIRRRRRSESGGDGASTTPLGVSKSTVGSTKATPVLLKAVPGKPVKVKGGDRQETTADALRSAALKQKARKSGPQALTNEEMRFLVDRLGLEKRLSEVAPKYKTKGQKFVQDFLPGPIPKYAIKGVKSQLKPHHDPRIAKGLDFTETLLSTLRDSQKSSKKKNK
jgi:hypothetical protein